jgi:hypothetical protein
MNRYAVAAVLLAALASCEGAVDFRANYNPLQHRITIVGRAQGATRSKTIAVDGLTLDDEGCAYIEDPDCGVVKICGAAGGNVANLKIVCNDPLLIQVPESWTPLAGTWAHETDGSAGEVLFDSAHEYLPPADASVVVEPGMRTIVAMADTVFENGFVGELRAEIDTAEQDAVGQEIKGFEVMVATFFDASETEVAPPEIVVSTGTMELDFTGRAPFEIVVESEDDSDSTDANGEDAAGAGEGSSCACRSSPSPTRLGPWLLGVLAVRGSRRRAAR